MGVDVAGPALEERDAPTVEQYQEPAKFMTFTIIGARGFRNPHWMPFLGNPDCYMVVKSKGKEIAKTSVMRDSMEPLWKEEFEYKEWDKGAQLEFHLFAHKEWEEGSELALHRYLGKATIQYDRFHDGFNGDLHFEETNKDGIEHHHAYLRIKVKPPGKVYPLGPPVEFDVTLQRGKNKGYGIDVDTQDTKTLYIKGLVDGPASDFNQQTAPELQVVKSDFIVAANGASGDARTLLSKFRDDTVVMKIRRGIEVTLMLDRNKVINKDGTEGNLQPLGIEVSEHPMGDGLVVMAVKQGLFADWNKSQTEDPVAKVQVGDRIVRVGSTVGSARRISKATQEVSGKFQLSLVRIAPELFEEGQKKDGSSHWWFSH